MATQKLFQPITVGRLPLQHRVVLAPQTRVRASEAGVPDTPLVKEYYSQRACAPGTLLISESAFISPKASGAAHIPGLWNEEQLAAWKEITDDVHRAGSFIFAQLCAPGRSADEEFLRLQGFPYVSASDVALEGRPNPPRPLTQEEIVEFIGMFATAARNAVEKAGFDGVELHGANGYLLDQFMQDVTNNRTDGYGGSIENRSRFALEVVDAVVEAVGAKKVGYRVSPWSVFQEMRMEDPVPQFSPFVTELKKRHPDLAYLHGIEARVSGPDDIESKAKEDLNFLREIWSPLPFISAGGYTREAAVATAEKTGDLIAFGRVFISNPDLVKRLKEDMSLTPYDRDTFYTPGSKGYTDYPFADKD